MNPHISPTNTGANTQHNSAHLNHIHHNYERNNSIRSTNTSAHVPTPNQMKRSISSHSNTLVNSNTIYEDHDNHLIYQTGNQSIYSTCNLSRNTSQVSDIYSNYISMYNGTLTANAKGKSLSMKSIPSSHSKKFKLKPSVSQRSGLNLNKGLILSPKTLSSLREDENSAPMNRVRSLDAAVFNQVHSTRNNSHQITLNNRNIITHSNNNNYHNSHLVKTKSQINTVNFASPVIQERSLDRKNKACKIYVEKNKNYTEMGLGNNGACNFFPWNP